MSEKDIWSGTIGEAWDALENSFEENEILFGREVALAIETIKMRPVPEGNFLTVTNIDSKTKTITFMPVKGVLQ